METVELKEEEDSWLILFLLIPLVGTILFVVIAGVFVMIHYLT